MKTRLPFGYAGGDPTDFSDSAGLAACPTGRGKTQCGADLGLPPGFTSEEQFQRSLRETWAREQCEAQERKDNLLKVQRWLDEYHDVQRQLIDMQYRLEQTKIRYESKKLWDDIGQATGNALSGCATGATLGGEVLAPTLALPVAGEVVEAIGGASGCVIGAGIGAATEGVIDSLDQATPK
jgi:hypothetical protein